MSAGGSPSDFFGGKQDMKAQADNRPETTVKSNGKIQYNFNIKAVEKVDELKGTTHTVFEYEYVEVENTDRNTLVRAMMKDKYSIEDELALINNKFKGDPNGNIEYEDYQTYRQNVKLLVVS
jgi:hypothetical protein